MVPVTESLSESLTPILWAGFAFPIVLFLQRWITRHLQGVALLVTGQVQWSIVIYAIIMLPGVLLHELSHWLTANLLGVRTGRLSLWPKLQEDGTLRLGYVEYFKSASVGPIRETLIGGAPLIFGTAAVWGIGNFVFRTSDLLVVLQEGTPDALALVIDQVFTTPDFWVWLYLLFAISNAMMPSPSDRRAWPAFLALLCGLLIFLYILGLRADFWQGLIGPTAVVFGYLGMAFTLTIAVNLIFMAIIWFLEWMIGRLKGVHVQYG